jgi:anthranilate phosphoribosyltransferase
VVHGLDGLDEISTTGPTRVSELRDGKVRTCEVTPGDFGLRRVSPRDLEGGEPAQSAEVLLRALSGDASAARDIVALNAGGAIYVGGDAGSVEEGVEVAQETIRSGAAMDTLDALREMSQTLAEGREE